MKEHWHIVIPHLMRDPIHTSKSKGLDPGSRPG